MSSQNKLHFRLMTYNIGRGRKDLGSKLNAITQVIEEAQPDILALQEATEYEDADGTRFSDLDAIAAKAGWHVYFGPTLSMKENMHVRKVLFLQALFNDWSDWRQGNAILSRWEFVRLGNPLKPGIPKNVPLYRPPVYEGNRDTDPRYALVARVNLPPIYPFVVGVHLTTLVGEREGKYCPIPGKYEEAQGIRLKQAMQIITLLKEHILDRQEVVFLLGDFNAMAGEPCIAVLEEAVGGFVRLRPEQKNLIATHPKVSGPIDHIFVYAGGRALNYECRIVDSPLAQEASDHLPVVADVEIAV